MNVKQEDPASAEAEAVHARSIVGLAQSLDPGRDLAAEKAALDGSEEDDAERRASDQQSHTEEAPSPAQQEEELAEAADPLQAPLAEEDRREPAGQEEAKEKDDTLPDNQLGLGKGFGMSLQPSQSQSQQSQQLQFDLSTLLSTMTPEAKDNILATLLQQQTSMPKTAAMPQATAPAAEQGHVPKALPPPPPPPAAHESQKSPKASSKESSSKASTVRTAVKAKPLAPSLPPKLQRGMSCDALQARLDASPVGVEEVGLEDSVSQVGAGPAAEANAMFDHTLMQQPDMSKKELEMWKSRWVRAQKPATMRTAKTEKMPQELLDAVQAATPAHKKELFHAWVKSNGDFGQLLKIERHIQRRVARRHRKARWLFFADFTKHWADPEICEAKKAGAVLAGYFRICPTGRQFDKKLPTFDQTLSIS